MCRCDRETGPASAAIRTSPSVESATRVERRGLEEEEEEEVIFFISLSSLSYHSIENCSIVSLSFHESFMDLLQEEAPCEVVEEAVEEAGTDTIPTEKTSP